MRGHFLRNYSIGLIIGLLATSVSLAYLRQVDTTIKADEMGAQTILLETEKFRAESIESQKDKLERQLKEKETELQAKLAELDAKKAELEKTNQEITAKIAELDAAKKKITDQQSQLSANSTELSKLRNRPPLFTFTVESSQVADIDQKKEDVKQLVTNAYDVIEDVYSQAYLLHSVTIAFVESFSNPNAAAEIVISNGSDGLSLTIRIKDFNKNDFNDVSAIIHEIIHSFHGLAILDPVGYEEGITVAATDAVMTKLIAQGKIPAFQPLYIRISSGDYASGPSLPRSANSFYTSSQTATYYQMAGYGWYQLYKADTNFFKTFNEKIYSLKRDGNEITETVVKQAIKDSISASIQGKNVSEWLETKAFALQ